MFPAGRTVDAILEKVGKCKVILGTHHYHPCVSLRMIAISMIASRSGLDPVVSMSSTQNPEPPPSRSSEVDRTFDEGGVADRECSDTSVSLIVADARADEARTIPAVAAVRGPQNQR